LPRWRTWLSAGLAGDCGADSADPHAKRWTPRLTIHGCATLRVVEATELEQAPRRPSILRRILAVLVIIAAVALVIHLIAGLLMTIFYVALAVAILIAVLWALNTLL
jgi:hypothetical protein